MGVRVGFGGGRFRNGRPCHIACRMVTAGAGAGAVLLQQRATPCTPLSCCGCGGCDRHAWPRMPTCPLQVRQQLGELQALRQELSAAQSAVAALRRAAEGSKTSAEMQVGGCVCVRAWWVGRGTVAWRAWPWVCAAHANAWHIVHVATAHTPPPPHTHPVPQAMTAQREVSHLSDQVARLQESLQVRHGSSICCHALACGPHHQHA